MAWTRIPAILFLLAAPACTSNAPGHDSRAAAYADDAVIHRDYQTAFCGAALPVYLTTLAGRRTARTFETHVTETFALADDKLVFGTFTAEGSMAGGQPFREEGRFARLWSPGPDGEMWIVAEIIGHPAHQDDPETYNVAGLSDDCSFPAEPASVGEDLADINSRIAATVKAHEAAPQIAFEGSAKLEPGALDVLDRVCDVIKDRPNHIRIEGHTDDWPINTAIGRRASASGI